MPIHDWTRVSAGTVYDFHMAWIAELRRVLNGGLLPSGYYAMAEQVANQVIPDVLTLQGANPEPDGNTESESDPQHELGGVGLAVAKAPPKVSLNDSVSEAMLLAARRRRLVIRHSSGDRIVALLEIVSPGNKERRPALESFIDKAVGALDAGYHLLVLDVLPPGQYDPTGIHGAIWHRLGGEYEPPENKPLTLASYAAAGAVTCYVEPTKVGAELIPMPLFLDPEHYVYVPLEPTYLAAYEGVPRKWKRVIEAP